MQYISEEKEKAKKLLLPVLLKFLIDKKKELEAKGLIATIDEAINDLKSLEVKEPLVFETNDEANEYFQKHTVCQSDDVDAEDYRFEKWCESNEVIIKENE